MKPTIDVHENHLKIILEILYKWLPANSMVWVFGSRTKKAKKKYSDLDLAIDANGQSVPSDIMINLTDDFDESDLPYKVDIIDWNSTTESFKKLIQNERVLLVKSI